MSNLTIDVESLRKKISDLGYGLEKLGAEKEALYKEKKSLDEKLSSAINSAKELKTKKASIDLLIKEKKQLRTVLNKDIKNFSKKISELKKTMRRTKTSISPIEMVRQIEAMQYAIETEGLPFEKEKAYMEKINQYKLKLAELEKEGKKPGSLLDLRAKLANSKAQADALHLEIQKLADESTQLFNILTAKAEEIAELKQMRQKLLSKLKEIKANIENFNVQLAEALNAWLQVSKTAPPIVTASENISAEDIFNKFKNAKRLTKEDILKLQRFAAKRYGHPNQGIPNKTI